MVRLAWPGWWLGLTLALAVPGAAQERPPAPRAELRENYPNPFYPSTTIPFVLLPEACAKSRTTDVSLKIYNVLVQVVAVPVLDDGSRKRLDGVKLPCGEHRAFWDGRRLDKQFAQPGVYYVQLTVGEQRYTRKMVVQRPSPAGS